MKISISSMLAPGQTLVEKIRWTVDAGFDGIELRIDTKTYDEAGGSQFKAVITEIGLQVSLIILAEPSFSLPLNDPCHVDAKMATLRRNLQLASEFGAVSIFVAEYRAQSPLPLWEPPKQMSDCERDNLVEILMNGADLAEELDGYIALEPLNRYETPYIHTISDALEICQRVDSPRVGILADFFHMNIEEKDIAAALRSAAGKITYVQLGDSNRFLPGQGHTDFLPAFAELVRQKYAGFLSLECNCSGALDEEVAASTKYIQKMLERAAVEQLHDRGRQSRN